MKTASTSDLKTKLESVLKASEHDPVVVTRQGKPIAFLLGVDDPDEVERMLMAQSPKLRAILDAARKRLNAGQGIPHDDFWAEFLPPKTRTGRSRPRSLIKAKRKSG